MPCGERLGSAVVICPASRNGSRGTTPATTWLNDSCIAETESATCRQPGAAGGAEAHGTGPSRAQSTLTVPGSSSKRVIARATDAGRSSGATSRS